MYFLFVQEGDTSLGFTPTVGATPGLLPDTPANLRESGNFHRMPVLIGKTDREVGPGFVFSRFFIAFLFQHFLILYVCPCLPYSTVIMMKKS